MIEGIGIDLVDIERFDNLVRENPRFLEKFFSHEERQCKQISSIATKFAAKEALVKASTRFSLLDFKQIEVLNSESGAPFFRLHGEISNLSEGCIIHLSISHEAGIGVAMVVIERKID
jgi:holo-[acyl-carrier protein] synthase